MKLMIEDAIKESQAHTDGGIEFQDNEGKHRIFNAEPVIVDGYLYYIKGEDDDGRIVFFPIIGNVKSITVISKSQEQASKEEKQKKRTEGYTKINEERSILR